MISSATRRLWGAVSNGFGTIAEPNGENLSYPESETDDQEWDFGGDVPMGRYMHVINGLTSICSELVREFQIKVPHPKIVVIGGQTSGKSALLEQIAHQEFLPRGSGKVTKGSIEIKFHKSEIKNFVINGVTYQCGLEARDAIQRLSDSLATANVGVFDKPLQVDVYSPEAPDMTLIDLPGLFEVTLDDENPQLPKHIENLIQTFVNDPHVIILVVQPATEDMAKARCINLARQADPDGKRTIAVLTKLDRVQSGDETALLKSNLEFGRKLIKLGVIGVVNRSENNSFTEATKTEAQVIVNHFKEKSVEHGINYLAHKIGSLLLAQMKENMEVTIRVVQAGIRDEDDILHTLGGGEIIDRRQIMNATLLKFAKEYKEQLDGVNRGFLTCEDGGGFKIRQCFTKTFTQDLHAASTKFDVDRKEIIYAIRNARGTGGSTFLTEVAFEIACKREILKMEPPCIALVDNVYNILAEEMPRCCYPFRTAGGLGKYPPLQQEILGQMGILLEASRMEALHLVRDYIDMQASIVVSYAPHFTVHWKGSEFKQMFIITEDEVNALDAGLSSASTTAAAAGSIRTSTGDICDTQRSNDNKEDGPGALEAIGEGLQDFASGAAAFTAGGIVGGSMGAIKMAQGGKKIVQGMTNMVDGAADCIGSTTLPATKRGEQIVDFLVSLVERYVGIVAAQTNDHIPKIVTKHLVQKAADNAYDVLVNLCTDATKSNREQELIQESDEVVAKRSAAMQRKSKLEEAFRRFQISRSLISRNYHC